MRQVFGTYHPIINFSYFCAVIVLGMFFLHPVLLTIGVLSAFIYSVCLSGKKALKFNLCFLLPMMLAVCLINPLFNHRGVTILGYLGDNPITFESIIYGVVTGFMFATILLWFSCYNVIMTSDKFLYLFGGIVPAMSLVFSMVLRFVPNFKQQIKVISTAQKCVGRDVSNGTLVQKAKHGMKILSIMITWALENAVDTADSMRSRGYGLKGRTNFSLYRFDGRDAALLLVMTGLTTIVLLGGFIGKCKAQYFPQMEFSTLDPFSIVVYLAYLILCCLPIILEVKEAVQWQHLQSKI
ncbi:MAG: energy-coupling factor transporter transmembrane component T [Anaerovoracaceae bacterium]